MHFRLSSRLSLSILSTLGALTFAQSEISYRVTVDPAAKKLSVEVVVPVKSRSVDMQIANWMPGAYAYGNYYENVHDVTAVSSKDKALIVTHPDKNTWSVAGGQGVIKFSYWMPLSGGRRFGQTPDPSFVQISGAPTYMYVVGRKLEPCRIQFLVPDGWPLLTGLDSAGRGKYAFKAPTFDVLADNPVSTGDILVDEYNLRGKNHYVVVEGAAKAQVDRAKLLRDCRFVSAAETDFFGGAPYHKYVWHFSVYPGEDGAGGLEHLSSTQISLASGEGPRAQSVLAHEYFHLWNVKRIRSSALGPFDYLTLPKTGALWWLEGTTDYYATLLPYRYGEWKRSMFLDGIVSNMNAVLDNPAYLEVGSNEASLRVSEAENGRGNSNGYKISYYNLGWLSGMCLDTEIRAQTKNKHSLDDVIHALYELCKDGKPGFEEDEIRKQCIRFGGQSLGPFYDKVVLKAGQMPLREQLEKMGLQLNETEQPYTDLGFSASPVRGGKGLQVRTVRASASGKLMTGDVILSIDDKTVDTEDARANTLVMRGAEAKAAVGTAVALKVRRGETTMDVSMIPVTGMRKVRTVVEDPNASAAAISLREGWLKTKVPSVQ